MKSLAIAAIHSTWLRFFRGESRLLHLPEDIIVDEIFVWLSVIDIIRLRQVCKALSVLSKKPAIWKRFIPYITQIQQPLAPLPPTIRYGLRNLTGLEVETMVTRALSYDMAWKGQKVKYWNTFSSFTHHETVHEMVILPGGHYVVMSAKSFAGMHGIVIWSLQHQASRAPTPLLFRHTEHKAYGLSAKYMTVNGIKGITVAFLRKSHKSPDDTRHIPETFEMGGREEVEDPYMPLRYECTALHVDLRVLDFLDNRHVEPQTSEYAQMISQMSIGMKQFNEEVWVVVARIRSGTQLGVVSLDWIAEFPTLCVVKRPNTIVMQRLGENARTTIKCLPTNDHPGAYHSIWNFRVIHDQHEIIVVRNIDKRSEIGMANDHLAIEMYDIPDLTQTVEAKFNSRTLLIMRTYLNVQISEIRRTIPICEDDSITPLLKQRTHPPPISVFLRTNEGMAHHSIWPVEVHSPDSTSPQYKGWKPTDNNVQGTSKAKKVHRRNFIYDVTRTKHTFFGGSIEYMSAEMTSSGGTGDLADRDNEDRKTVKRRKDDVMRFLPGAYRALVYAIPRSYRSTEPPITACWGFQYNKRDNTLFLSEQPPPPPPGEEALQDFFPETEPEADMPDSPLEGDIEIPDDTPYHPSLDIPLVPMERQSGLGAMKLPSYVRAELLGGASAICFDEDTGRVVVVTKCQKRMHVVDFGSTRPRDDEDIMLANEMDGALVYEQQSNGLPVQFPF